MRSDTKRAFVGATLLAAGAVVTLATSMPWPFTYYGGTYSVDSTCSGFQESGTLKATFINRLGSNATPAPDTKELSTPAPTTTPPDETSAVPTATPAAPEPVEGTAPGAKVFGFPSERFTVDSVRPGFLFESAANGRNCRALAKQENQNTLVFLCREDVSDAILCTITLKKQN